jgi:membrane protease YdiL (CAAX protease family)
MTFTALLVVAVLIVVNVAEKLIPHSSVVVGPVAAAALIVLSHRAGLTWDDEGLARRTWGKGTRWALVCVGAVAAVYTVAALLPATRSAFDDERYQHGLGRTLVTVLVVIPLGTVLLEEVAFRGVLWGALRREYGVIVATAVSSLLFGLWHVLPSLNLAESNKAVEGVFGSSGIGQVLAVLGTVVFTALAGVVFCELRRRSESLIAPFGLHWATNALGVIVTAVLFGLGVS